MKILRGNRLVVAILSAAVGSVMVGRAEKPMTSLQPEPGHQDSGQKQIAMI